MEKLYLVSNLWKSLETHILRIYTHNIYRKVLTKCIYKGSHCTLPQNNNIYISQKYINIYCAVISDGRKKLSWLPLSWPCLLWHPESPSSWDVIRNFIKMLLSLWKIKIILDFWYFLCLLIIIWQLYILEICQKCLNSNIQKYFVTVGVSCGCPCSLWTCRSFFWWVSLKLY